MAVLPKARPSQDEPTAGGAKPLGVREAAVSSYRMRSVRRVCLGCWVLLAACILPRQAKAPAAPALTSQPAASRDGPFVLEGYIVEIERCPPCPQDAQCEN